MATPDEHDEYKVNPRMRAVTLTLSAVFSLTLLAYIAIRLF